MFKLMWEVLLTGVQKVRELKFALAVAAIAAAVAIAASFLRGYLSTVGGVVIAVNMGVMLMIAVLMFRAAAKATGQAKNSYTRLYAVLAWVFSGILTASAILSLTSVFFHLPLDLRDAELAPVEGVYNGDYRIDETVIMTDLRRRIPTQGVAGVKSRDAKYRIDRVVRQRSTNAPYQMQSGTNGEGIEEIVSPTHVSMTTEEVVGSRFSLTTKHTYIHAIPADRFPINEPVTVQLQGVFVNAFAGEEEEWVGACPNVDTESLTLVVLFPESKLCKDAWAMEQPTGSGEINFRGKSAPVVHDGGRMVTWTIARPSKGVGYFIAFKW